MDRPGTMSYIRPPFEGTRFAGWSSPVARQAHNLKVTGSNPVPATSLRSVAILLYHVVYPTRAGTDWSVRILTYGQ